MGRCVLGWLNRRPCGRCPSSSNELRPLLRCLSAPGVWGLGRGFRAVSRPHHRVCYAGDTGPFVGTVAGVAFFSPSSLALVVAGARFSNTRYSQDPIPPAPVRLPRTPGPGHPNPASGRGSHTCRWLETGDKFQVSFRPTSCVHSSRRPWNSSPDPGGDTAVSRACCPQRPEGGSLAGRSTAQSDLPLLDVPETGYAVSGPLRPACLSVRNVFRIRSRWPVAAAALGPSWWPSGPRRVGGAGSLCSRGRCRPKLARTGLGLMRGDVTFAANAWAPAGTRRG